MLSARQLLLLLITISSGFAGLGYEMVWTRMLDVALGVEMLAVLGAVAGLFVGLGLGALLFDAPIRRAARPSRVYAALELTIAAWGLCCLWLLPFVARHLPAWLGAEPSNMALWATSFGLPILALLPATTAMGGTLPALERAWSVRFGQHRFAAGLYAANTAGAVFGALASVFVLFAAFGLRGTLATLVVVNVCCAIGILRVGDGPAVEDPLATRTPARIDVRLLATICLTGLFGIAVEIVVVRLAAQLLQNTIYTFASLLATYLLGITLGGAARQRATRRADDDSSGMLLVTTAAAVLVTAATLPAIASLANRITPGDLGGELLVAGALFMLPSLLMGALFGDLLQRIRDTRGSIGLAVGVNALGAAAGPMLAALVLIPTLGSVTALIVLGAGYLLLLPPRRRVLLAALPCAALALLAVLQGSSAGVRIPDGGHRLTTREGSMVTASVVDDESGARYLEVNGHFRMGGTNSMRSDYRQALLPLLLHPAPHTALYLGVGTGATLSGAASYPGLAVQGIELSAEVVSLLPYFTNPGAPDPQPLVVTADARRFVAAAATRYDVIVADNFHPALEGSGALYTVEHFAAARRRLAAGGLFCQWLPLYQLDARSLRTIIRTFLRVYPDGSAWLAHFSVRMPMLALVGRADGSRVDAAALAQRLAEPGLQARVSAVGLGLPADVLGTFLGGPRTLATFAGPGVINDDDHPRVALDARDNVRALARPPGDLLLAVAAGIHPEAAELLTDPQAAPLAARLAAYWRARNRFLEAGVALQGDPRGRALIAAAAPGLLDAVRLSPEFEPAYQPLLGMARALAEADVPAARRLLEALAAAAPGRPEANEALAALPGS